ncbi:hypothetical protein LZ31DRAFT_150004 [Colletotrichum somersetense]|nr:hypothetical protein LZ31DRAFT_150004 [Colletotrichum somersetense]
MPEQDGSGAGGKGHGRLLCSFVCFPEDSSSTQPILRAGQGGRGPLHRHTAQQAPGVRLFTRQPCFPTGCWFPWEWPHMKAKPLRLASMPLTSLRSKTRRSTAPCLGRTGRTCYPALRRAAGDSQAVRFSSGVSPALPHAPLWGTCLFVTR